jgi:diphosphomevalonate decarboxylase
MGYRSVNKIQVVKTLLSNHSFQPERTSSLAFAPANIALCKYWGKRNEELNLPANASLSISLGKKGSTTHLQIDESLSEDTVFLNQEKMTADSTFAQSIRRYLDLLLGPSRVKFQVNTCNTIPTAAGFASSASGFAALILSLNSLFDWRLSTTELSILARLGSGSACRSLWSGFVEWQLGQREDGMDSHGIPLDYTWPELRIGLLVVSSETKVVSSRIGMQRTTNTSKLYPGWLNAANCDLPQLKTAIKNLDFTTFGSVAERNALTMHATMLASNPPFCYFAPETISLMQRIWQLRQDGLPIYFTQDAGPNLKLLFLDKDRLAVLEAFPGIIVLTP